MTINMYFKLKRHATVSLQNNGDSDIMERIQLSLPSFHAYGHKPQCQVCIVFSCSSASSEHVYGDVQFTTEASAGCV